MLSSPISFIFFAVFAAILVGMYLAIRREWAPTGLVTVVGTCWQYNFNVDRIFITR